MALSQTASYSLTRDQIIRSAFEVVCEASANEPIEAEDLAVAGVILNALSLSWKAHGLQLWKRSSASLTLVAATSSYSLTPTLGSTTEKPMRVLFVNRKETSSGIETPINKLSREEYEALPNKTETGTPVSYYFSPERTTSTMYLWLTPGTTEASDFTIEYVYTAPIQDMDVGTEEVDYPNEWYRALILNLAYDMSGRYGMDTAERRLLREDAEAALELAKDYDVEDTSIYFRPNSKRGS